MVHRKHATTAATSIAVSPTQVRAGEPFSVSYVNAPEGSFIVLVDNCRRFETNVSGTGTYSETYPAGGECAGPATASLEAGAAVYASAAYEVVA